MPDAQAVCVQAIPLKLVLTNEKRARKCRLCQNASKSVVLYRVRQCGAQGYPGRPLFVCENCLRHQFTWLLKQLKRKKADALEMELH